MSIDAKKVRTALKHLRAADPVMRDVIRRVGPFQLKLERDRFVVLVRSIISQQISTSAARSIRTRLFAAVGPGKPTAENLMRLPDDELRAAGISPQKLNYMRDLCENVLDGRLTLNHIGRKSDEGVIDDQEPGAGILDRINMLCQGPPDVHRHHVGAGPKHSVVIFGIAV